MTIIWKTAWLMECGIKCTMNAFSFTCCRILTHTNCLNIKLLTPASHQLAPSVTQNKGQNSSSTTGWSIFLCKSQNAVNKMLIFVMSYKNPNQIKLEQSNSLKYIAFCLPISEDDAWSSISLAITSYILPHSEGDIKTMKSSVKT